MNSTMNDVLAAMMVLYAVFALVILTRVFVWEPLPIGSKSVLLGAHCFPIHWFFVALGWFKTYGLRPVYIGCNVRAFHPPSADGDFEITWVEVYAHWYSPALWLSFLVHDIGYWGKPNMDGEEGESHPERGAEIVSRYFGEAWHDFVLLHSRFYAKLEGQAVSPLCIADKVAFVLTPRWLLLRLTGLTGEINEYMAKSDEINETGDVFKLDRSPEAKRRWHAAAVKYTRAWIATHKDGRKDTWTPGRRRAA